MYTYSYKENNTKQIFYVLEQKSYNALIIHYLRIKENFRVGSHK